MTGSWLMDYFIYGCVILMIVPITACILRALKNSKKIKK